MSGESTTERFDTVVIGAARPGWRPATTSRSSVGPSVILDANERIGDQWRRRYESLRLFSPARWDGLPGHAVPGTRWSYPTGRQMATTSRRMPPRAAGANGARVDRLAGRRRLRRLVASRAAAIGLVRSSWPPARSRSPRSPRSPVSSTRRSGNSTRASTATHRSSATARSSSSGVGHSGADIAYEAATPTGRSCPGLARRAPVPRARHVASLLGLPVLGSSRTTSSRSGRRWVGRASQIRMAAAPLVRVRRGRAGPGRRRTSRSEAWRAGRQAGARRRLGPRRHEHHLGDGLPARLRVDRGCRSTAPTAGRARSAACRRSGPLLRRPPIPVRPSRRCSARRGRTRSTSSTGSPSVSGRHRAGTGAERPRPDSERQAGRSRSAGPM